MFQDDEDAASVLTLEESKSWKEIFPEADINSLGNIAKLYDEICSNYLTYLESSKTDNVGLTGSLSDWSVRKTSHDPDRIKLVVKEILDNDNPQYADVDEMEIYLKQYEFKPTNDGEIDYITNVSLFSYVNNIDFQKETFKFWDDLSEVSNIKVGTFKVGENPFPQNGTDPFLDILDVFDYPEFKVDDYVLVAFYSSGTSNPDFVFQLIPNYKSTKDFEVAMWLRQLGVYLDLQKIFDNFDVLSNNVVLGNDDYIFISNLPAMPSIKFKPTTLDEEITVSLSASYEIKYSYLGIEYPFNDDVFTREIKIKPDEEYEFVFNDFRGGTLALSSGGKVMKLHIRGENPTEAEVIDRFDDLGAINKYWFIIGLTRQESSFMQFNYKESATFKPISNLAYKSSVGQKGLPYYGGPKGFGLTQLDGWDENGLHKVCSSEERWNWKSNVDAGVKVIETKIKQISASGYAHQKWHDKIVLWDNDHPLNFVEPLPDFTLGGTIFSYGKSSFFNWIYSGAVDEGKYSFLDANLIKSFNGGYLIYLRDEEYNDDGDELLCPPYWEIKESAKEYVEFVCEKNQ